MPASLFTTLDSELTVAGLNRRTTRARDWFIRRLKTLNNVTPNKVLRDPELIKKTKPLPGRMFMFIYDPKLKAELPYYDKFPLILMVGPAEGGFYGLNLHYLAPRPRARFLDRIMQYATSSNLTENTRIQMTYNFLKKSSNLKDFGPCFKHYLTNHVRSNVMMVPATEWDIAIFLPTERFIKASKETVWKDSRSMVK